MIVIRDALRFLNDFFITKRYEFNNTTITLDERACYDINSEDYRFRIKIAEVVDEIDVYCRDMAIEDHHNQFKHQKPHLQFKLHADGVGHIHIFLPIKNIKDYEKYILSFIDIVGSILIKIDTPNKELQNKLMIMDSFKKIKGMGNEIKKLVSEKYKHKEIRLLTFNKEEREITEEDIEKIKKIPQVSPFFDNL